MTPLTSKKSPLQLILDQNDIFVGNVSGTILLRGEVIINFPKDTPIIGAINLEFEGIQKFEPWPDILDGGSANGPIVSKLHVIELSLLPPNSHGIMPAGIQRFPFEFPLPGSLPASLYIPNRLNIFYRLKASVRRQTDIWSSLGKRVITAVASVRIVRTIEPIPGLTSSPHLNQQDNHGNVSGSTGSGNLPPQHSSAIRQSQSLERYFGDLHEPGDFRSGSLGYHENPSLISTSSSDSVHFSLDLDEQHDRLAYSMSGRTASNRDCPLSDSEHGLRYQLSIDRTAIAIGTSIGIDVILEPALYNATIQSITATITETREYAMKVPKGYGGYNKAETKRSEDAISVTLKWAYGCPREHDNDSTISTVKTQYQALSFNYRRQRCHGSCDVHDASITKNATSFRAMDRKNLDVKHSSTSTATLPDHLKSGTHCGQLNLKELHEELSVGEIFDGRFVYPVPGCDHLLKPSQCHDSVGISHWLRVNVGVIVNGKQFEISMSSPIRMLDCRVVSADDDRQTILPPPPSYESSVLSQTSPVNSDTFWVQRWSITQDAVWGTCNLCPCEDRKLRKLKPTSTPGQSVISPSVERPIQSVPPDWEAPPQYSGS